MKTFLFAAALMIGGAAYAQDTSGGTQGTTASAGTVAPSNAAPKRDARGVPVISAPAEVPAGYNQPPNTTGMAPSTGANPTMAPAGPLPPCTRKRTDNCTQTYERHHGDAGSATTSSTTDVTAVDASGSTDTATETTTTTKKTTHHRRARRHHK
jgi:hypothetical protein